MPWRERLPDDLRRHAAGSSRCLSDIATAPLDAARARQAFEAVAANRKEIPEIIDRVVD